MAPFGFPLNRERIRIPVSPVRDVPGMVTGIVAILPGGLLTAICCHSVGSYTPLKL